MGLAEAVDAPVLLAGDIDRGGVFAQLYGTAALLEPHERRRLRGLILNKFRGDISLLRPGLGQLEELCAAPVLGAVPWLDVRLDDEDSLSPALSVRSHGKPLDITVLRLPRISNFTDLAPLDRHPLLGVRYAGNRFELGTPDLVILPGTKSTIADLHWLRETGLAEAVLDRAASGTPILGICGGFQMLGQTIEDPLGVETAQGAAAAWEGNAAQDMASQSMEPSRGKAEPEDPTAAVRGLGLLPCRTVFGGGKKRARVRGTVTAGPLSGAQVEGYEIHMGITEAAGAAGSPPEGEPFCVKEDGTPEGWRRENVWGTYLHGLFDTGALGDRLAAYLCARKGISCTDSVRGAASALYTTATLETQTEYRARQYDLLADGVRAALDMDRIRKIIEEWGR